MEKHKRKKPEMETKNCFLCDNCIYVGEGGYICSMTTELIIDEFIMPTEEFYSCDGKDFEPI